jgi:LysM repeat protein
MTHRLFTQVSTLLLLLIASIATPVQVLAGGVCGGTYIVEKGETFSSIAAKCGTTVSIIMAANPGVSEPLKTGQSITVPGLTSTSNNTPTGPIVDNTSSNNNSSNYGPVSYTNIYIVQVGDTFSSIAARYGVSVNALWAANPYIWDINYIFVGQSIYVPASSSPGGVISTLPPEPDHLSYGTVPWNAPKGKIELSNKANGNVYVSLQGTTPDGIRVINEYSVNGQMEVKVPAGSYTYVASVGGVKFVGQFHLGGGGEKKITFFAKKVLVE